MCNKMHSLVYQSVLEEKIEGCGGGWGGGRILLRGEDNFPPTKRITVVGWGAAVVLAVSLSQCLHQHKNRKKERPQFIR